MLRMFPSPFVFIFAILMTPALLGIYREGDSQNSAQVKYQFIG